MPLCLTCVWNAWNILKPLSSFCDRKSGPALPDLSTGCWICQALKMSYRLRKPGLAILYMQSVKLKISADRDSLCRSPPLQFPPLSSWRDEGVPSVAARSNAHAALHSWKVVDVNHSKWRSNAQRNLSLVVPKSKSINDLAERKQGSQNHDPTKSRNILIICWHECSYNRAA